MEIILVDFGCEGLEGALVCEGKGDNERSVLKWETGMGEEERGKAQGEYIHNMLHTCIRGLIFKVKRHCMQIRICMESQNLTTCTTKERLSLSNRESIYLEYNQSN